MKLYLVVLLWCGLQLQASAATIGPGGAPGPAGEVLSPEGEFHDPFAKESEKAQGKVSDPLEGMNRAFFKFNDKLYFWALKPVAKGYNKVAPLPFRESMKRLFINAQFPVRFVNNLLQGKLKNVGVETARFLVNSTVGIGGMFDPAREEWNLQPKAEDLDQTFGRYGIPPGFYINWPFLGPSSVRGTAGLIGDGFLTPWAYIDGFAVLYSVRAFDTINSTSLQIGEYETFKSASFDPYVAIRDAYYQSRQRRVIR